MMNILAVGVFDLFHRGHVEFLEKAATIGDNLFVVINGDALTERYKRRPIYSENDRKKIIDSMRCVSSSAISNEFDIKPFVEKFKINIIVHGDDWEHESYLKQVCIDDDYILQKNIRFEYLKYWSEVSTSMIINKIRG